MARTSITGPPPKAPTPSPEPPLLLPKPQPQSQPRPQPPFQLQPQPRPLSLSQPQPLLPVVQPQQQLHQQIPSQRRLQPWPPSQYLAGTSSVGAARGGQCRGLSWPRLSTNGLPLQPEPAANFYPERSAADDGDFYNSRSACVNTRQVFSGESSFSAMLAEQPINGAEMVVNEQKPPVNNEPSVTNVEPQNNVEEQRDSYFELFPPGWRFCPTDEQLVLDYLKPKILNKELPKNKIKYLNIYKHHPANLAAMYEKWGDDKWYFFSSRERKYRNGSRPARGADGGYWKATGADKEIKSPEGAIIGSRTILVFHDGKSQKGVKSNWMMYEYQYADAPPHQRVGDNDMTLDDVVLCKIYKKPESSSKKRARQSDTEEEGPEEEDPHAPDYDHTFNHHQLLLQQPLLQQPPQLSQLLRLPSAHPQTPSLSLMMSSQLNNFYSLVSHHQTRPMPPGFAMHPIDNSWPEFSNEIPRSGEQNSGLLEDIVNVVRPSNGNDGSFVDVVMSYPAYYEYQGGPSENLKLEDRIYQELGYVMIGNSKLEDLRNLFSSETNVSLDLDNAEDKLSPGQNTDHTVHHQGQPR